MIMDWAEKAGAFPVPEQYNGKGTAEEPQCGDGLMLCIQVSEFGVIDQAGFSLIASENPVLKAFATYLCSSCQRRPVLACMTVEWSQTAAAFAADGELDPADVPYAMMTEIALKKSLADYGRHFQ